MKTHDTYRLAANAARIVKRALTSALFAIMLLAPALETSAQVADKEWKELEETLRQSCALICSMMDVQELSEGITAECYSKTAARFIVRSMKKNHVKVPSEDAIMVFAIEFLTKIMDENDPMHVEFFSEISLECATRASRVQVEGPASARVSLSRFDEMFKIKITLGKSSKYYLMDTGASNCFISMSYAQELFEEGIISGENVLEPGLYEMANGDIARCNRVLVHRVKVGPYILDNVIFSVIDEEIGFICGKNILDAFQSWKIYNNPPALELSR